MEFKDLTDEQKAKACAAKTPEEILPDLTAAIDKYFDEDE